MRTLIDKMPDGLVYMKMICNEKTQTIDFEIVQVNKSFENLMSIKAQDVFGKTLSAQFPEFHNLDLNLLENFEKVSKNKTDEKFEVYFKSMDKV